MGRKDNVRRSHALQHRVQHGRRRRRCQGSYPQLLGAFLTPVERGWTENKSFVVACAILEAARLLRTSNSLRGLEGKKRRPWRTPQASIPKMVYEKPRSFTEGIGGGGDSRQQYPTTKRSPAISEGMVLYEIKLSIVPAHSDIKIRRQALCRQQREGRRSTRPPNSKEASWHACLAEPSPDKPL